jgi:hypothetical protein
MDILKRTLDKGEVTPEIVENMLFSKFPSVIKGLYDNLTPNGRSVARAAIISRAARESEVQEGARTVIDPTKFADNVKNLGESVNVFFTGDDLKRVEGLVKVLNATRRAGEVAARAGEEPSVGRMAGTVGTVTGVAGLPLAGLYQLFGGGILGGAAATVGVGTLGAAARIYESAAMRDLLRKVAAAKPGEEMALITKLSTLKVPTPNRSPNNDRPQHPAAVPHLHGHGRLAFGERLCLAGHGQSRPPGEPHHGLLGRCADDHRCAAHPHVWRLSVAQRHACTAVRGVRLLDPGAEQEWLADLRFAERQCFLRWRRVGSIKRHRQRLADHLPGVVSPEGDLHQRCLSEPEHLHSGRWERDVL